MVSAAFSRVAIAVFTVSLLAVTAEPQEHPCLRVMFDCDFFFDSDRDVYFPFIVEADQLFTPNIVSGDKNETLGLLQTNIVPEFVFNDDPSDYQQITDFGTPNFSPSAFKPLNRPGTPFSGLAHEVLRGNQRETATNKCIRVYFSEYQLLSKDQYGNYNVIETKTNVPKYKNKCVAFNAAEPLY